MLEDIIKTVLESGLLGIAAVGGVWFAWKKDRETKKLHEEHANEMRVMTDRYIVKAESWMKQYGELSMAITDILEKVERRYVQ